MVCSISEHYDTCSRAVLKMPLASYSYQLPNTRVPCLVTSCLFWLSPHSTTSPSSLSSRPSTPKMGDVFYGHFLDLCFCFWKILDVDNHFPSKELVSPTMLNISTTLSRPAYAEATDFRRNPDCSLYVLAINCVVMGIVPFSLLIGINISIARYFNHGSGGRDK